MWAKMRAQKFTVSASATFFIWWALPNMVIVAINILKQLTKQQMQVMLKNDPETQDQRKMSAPLDFTIFNAVFSNSNTQQCKSKQPAAPPPHSPNPES